MLCTLLHWLHLICLLKMQCANLYKFQWNCQDLLSLCVQCKTSFKRCSHSCNGFITKVQYVNFKDLMSHCKTSFQILHTAHMVALVALVATTSMDDAIVCIERVLWMPLRIRRELCPNTMQCNANVCFSYELSMHNIVNGCNHIAQIFDNIIFQILKWFHPNVMLQVVRVWCYADALWLHLLRVFKFKFNEGTEDVMRD